MNVKLFLLLLFCQFNNSIISERDDLVYSEVIEVEDTNKRQLYNNALLWVADFYKSSDIITFKDEATGIIIINSHFEFNYYFREAIMSYTLKIETKENKYRYTIKELKYIEGVLSFDAGDFPKGWFGKKKFYRTIDSNVNSITENLKMGMSSKETEW